MIRRPPRSTPMRSSAASDVYKRQIWECEPSKFQWNYDDKEICLIIEGQAKIITKNGDIYFINAGDLVEFPAGLNCEWEVTKSIKKHYRLGS